MIEKWSWRSVGEGRTGDNRLVRIECAHGKLDAVKAVLKNDIYSLHFPETHPSRVGHGGYSRMTRFDIVQHKYAGGGAPGCGGYFEVLEIKNPPDGRCGFVLFESSSDIGDRFFEWETLEAALSAFGKFFTEDFEGLPGFIRKVECGADLVPWFYAIGEQELVADYAFPEGSQEDPVYSFGRKFLVYEGYDLVLAGHDGDGDPIHEEKEKWRIKTCLGCRAYFQSQSHGEPEKAYRVSYFDDGSSWNEKSDPQHRPRPVEDDKFFQEAYDEFVKFMKGEASKVEIRSPAGEVITFKRRKETLGQFA